MEREWEVINIKGQNMFWEKSKFCFMFTERELVQFENGGARRPTDQETVDFRDDPNAT